MGVCGVSWCDLREPLVNLGATLDGQNFLAEIFCGFCLGHRVPPPTNLCALKVRFIWEKPSQPHTQPSKFTTGTSTPIIGHVLHDQCNEQAKEENKERRHNYNNIRRAHSLFSS